MAIKYVILGFLSKAPLTGYDLKKKFSDSEIFHWSGNNNQIYRTLVELHEEGLVTLEVRYQENKPPRKIYTITDTGLVALRQWMLTTPELPQFRNALLVQLTWADQLAPADLGQMLAQYAEELRVHLLMLREQTHRKNDRPQSEPSKISFEERIAEHWISFYALELDWVRRLRQELDEG